MAETLTAETTWPEQPTFVFSKQPLVVSSLRNGGFEAIGPETISPGGIIKVGIGLIDAGVTDDERHVLLTQGVFSMGIHEFDEPQPAWLPLLIEDVDHSERRLRGLIFGEAHTVNKDGYAYGFKGYKLTAKYADLGIEAFPEGGWASDVVALPHGDEYLSPTPLTLEQKVRIGQLLGKMQTFIGRQRPTHLARLEAELVYDVAPLVSVEQLRGLIHHRF